jgi:hypothetical protein
MKDMIQVQVGRGVKVGHLWDRSGYLARVCVCHSALRAGIAACAQGRRAVLTIASMTCTDKAQGVTAAQLVQSLMGGGQPPAEPAPACRACMAATAETACPAAT